LWQRFEHFWVMRLPFEIIILETHLFMQAWNFASVQAPAAAILLPPPFLASAPPGGSATAIGRANA
jgi:hypothetical protein